MLKAGDVVLFNFVGATGVKRRPTVVVSSDLYHLQRPDLIVGVITSNVSAATSATDYIIQDWAAAGLRLPSAFRAYFSMAVPGDVRKVGEVSANDLKQIIACVHRALAS